MTVSLFMAWIGFLVGMGLARATGLNDTEGTINSMLGATAMAVVVYLGVLP